MPIERGFNRDIPITREALIEKLKREVELVALDLRAAGLPVGDDTRVDMRAFAEAGVYKKEQIEANLLGVASLQEHFDAKDRAKKKEVFTRGLNSRSINEKFAVQPKTDKREAFIRSGEQLEGLKTVIFHKFLKDHFITMRTSLYDDYKGGIDNLIIDKKTGNLIGAFDEVADDSNRAAYKREEIFARSTSGGGSIKYGFKMVDGRLAPAHIQDNDNVPILFLSLTTDDLKRGLIAMSSGDSKTEVERELFDKFIQSIKLQLGKFRELIDKKISINPEVVRRIEAFMQRMPEIEAAAKNE